MSLVGPVGQPWQRSFARNRRVCDDWMMNGDAPPGRLVAGVLRLNGQTLLCHRQPDRASWPHVWDLPGGHVDDDESVAEALVRELGEELGVQIEAPKGSPWMTIVLDGLELNLYLIDRWEGEPRNVALEEHDDIRWFAADDLELLDLAHPSYVEILQGAVAGGG
jgi:8-oxo-dGTP diphosphatase